MNGGYLTSSDQFWSGGGYPQSGPQVLWQQHVAPVAANEVMPVPVHVEIQREVDAMQYVYAQEKQILESLIRGLEEDHQHLRNYGHYPIEREEGQEDLPCAGGAAAPKREIKWRIDDPLAERSLRSCFQLHECPGVRFLMQFNSNLDAACSLVLKVDGPLTRGLVLEVELKIHMVGGASEETTTGHDDLMASKSAEMTGVAELACEGPALGQFSHSGKTGASFSALCCVGLSVQKWEAQAFRYESNWTQGKCELQSGIVAAHEAILVDSALFDSDSDADCDKLAS